VRPDDRGWSSASPTAAGPRQQGLHERFVEGNAASRQMQHKLGFRPLAGNWSATDCEHRAWSADPPRSVRVNFTCSPDSLGSPYHRRVPRMLLRLPRKAVYLVGGKGITCALLADTYRADRSPRPLDHDGWPQALACHFEEIDNCRDLSRTGRRQHRAVRLDSGLGGRGRAKADFRTYPDSPVGRRRRDFRWLATGILAGSRHERPGRAAGGLVPPVRRPRGNARHGHRIPAGRLCYRSSLPTSTPDNPGRSSGVASDRQCPDWTLWQRALASMSIRGQGTT